MNIAIIGAGMMGQLHAQAVSCIEGSSLVAFGVRTRKVAPEVADLAGRLGAEIVPSIPSTVERADVDAVIIATPTDTHLEVALAAARAGKHIVCEKPLARTLQEAEQIIEAADRAGVKLAVGQIVRYFPAYAALRHVILGGEIGTPSVARATRGSSFPQGTSNWFGDVQRSGGVILDLMIHDFDWMRWTLGPVERVYTRALPAAFQQRRDLAMTILTFQSGALGYVEGSWSYPSGFRTTLEVSGSAGLVRTANRKSAPLHFEFADTPGVTVAPSSLHADPVTAQLRDFLSWFAGGGPPRSSAQDGFEALRISLAALESASSGRPVQLARAHGK